MVEGLGGRITWRDAPFDPEVGAYAGAGHNHARTIDPDYPGGRSSRIGEADRRWTLAARRGMTCSRDSGKIGSCCFYIPAPGNPATIPAEVEAIELSPDDGLGRSAEPDAGRDCGRRGSERVDPAGQAELSEIETSSRLRTDGDVLCLSAPLVHRARTEYPGTTPVGFVLAPELLVTVRYEPLTAFDTYEREARGGAAEVFVGLIEAIVDRIADVLEHIAAELDTVSHRLFRSRSVGGGRPQHPRPGKRGSALDPAPARGQRRSGIENPRQPLGAGAYRALCRDDARCGTPGCGQDAPRYAAPRSGFAERLRDPSAEQGAAADGCDAWPDQCRAERHHQGADRGVGGRRAADAGREHVRHELQIHARTRLELGVSLWTGADRDQRASRR